MILKMKFYMSLKIDIVKQSLHHYIFLEYSSHQVECQVLDDFFLTAEASDIDWSVPMDRSLL